MAEISISEIGPFPQSRHVNKISWHRDFQL